MAFLADRTSLPIIGVGGILTRDDGRALLDAGAALLQVYTGFIYRGPALVDDSTACPLKEPDDHHADERTGYGVRLTAALGRPRPALRRHRPASGHPAALGPAERRRRAGALRPRHGRGAGRPVAVFKPQSAFFEAHGSAGIAVLERTLADLQAAGALCLLDVKRGDIGSTMDAYAAAYLTDGSPLAADAITLSPYLGFGSLAGAIDLAGRPGPRGLRPGPDQQPRRPAVPARDRAPTARRVGQTVIDEAAAINAGADGPARLGHVGIVVGATIGRTGIDFCRLNGSILAPGSGAQGGGADDLAEVFGPAARLVLPSTSREVLGAGPDPDALRAAATPSTSGRWQPSSAWGKFSSLPNLLDTELSRIAAVTIPPLSDEQRQQARNAATEARRRRAEVKQALRSGERSLAEVLELAEQDDVIAHTKVIDVLQVPAPGRCVRAEKVMDRLDIAANRRLRGLGRHQTAALIAEFGARPAGAPQS